MILHLLFDDKFADYTIRQFSPYGNSEFLIVHHSADEPIKHITLKEHLTRLVYRSVEYDSFLNGLGHYKALIVHGFYTPWQVEIVENVPESVKIAWAFWGGDLYQRPDVRDRYLAPLSKVVNHLHELKKPTKDDYIVPMNALQRVDYILDDMLENYEDVKRYINKPSVKYLWYQYYSIEQTVGTSLLERQAVGQGVLMGHSAGIRTNHIEGMLALRKLNLKNRKIITPLSYGSPWYRNLILRVGRLLFGESFVPLTSFMPRDEYNALICSCPAFICPAYKPEGMGNILTALWLGARVYLYKHNLKYQYLSRIGVRVFSIEDDLRRDNPEALAPISADDLVRNRSILQQIYGFAQMDSHILTIINTLEA